MARQGKPDIQSGKAPELYSTRPYGSRHVKTGGKGENKSFIQYLDKGMAKNPALKDLLRGQKAMLAEDEGGFKNTLENALFLPEMENNLEPVMAEENLALCGENLGFISSSEKNDFLADSLTGRFYEAIGEKLAEKAINPDKISLNTNQSINANQREQIALMLEELLSDPEITDEIKEGAVKVRELLLKETSINTDPGKPNSFLDKKPDVLSPLIRLSENREETLKNSSLNADTDQIKNLIQFEQSRLAGKRAEKMGKEDLKVDEAITDKKDALALLEGNRVITDSKKPISFVNQPSKQLPLNPKEVFDQIVKKAELMLKQGASEMKIQLKPEFLGKMTIKILVDEGVVTARFIAENLKVKQLLESNLNTLRQSLESQGLRVEKAEVNVQLNNGGMFDGSENSRQFLWHKPEFSSAIIKDKPIEESLVTAMDSEENAAMRESFYEKDSLNSTMSFLI